jgi:hypothetical protein
MECRILLFKLFLNLFAVKIQIVFHRRLTLQRSRYMLDEM